MEAAAVVEPEVFVTEEKPAKKTEATDSIVGRSVFVSISVGRPGNHRKVSSDAVIFKQNGFANVRPYEDQDLPEDGVDRSFVGISKKLTDCSEYKAIVRADGLFKKLVSLRCADSRFRVGMFILPKPLIPEVDGEYIKAKSKRKELIAAYKAVYDQRVEEALGRLGPIGNRADYPPWSEVEKLFRFEMQYVRLGAPVVLGDVDEAIFQREQQKFEAQMVDALDTMKDGLREQMLGLVNHMVERLSGDREESCKACNGTGENRIPCVCQNPVPPTDLRLPGVCAQCEGKGYNASNCEKCEGRGKWIEAGKPKRFNSTLIENMNDFLKVFEARNLANDSDLSALVSKAKSLLSNNDAKKIKKDGDLRGEIAAGFEAIKAQLGSMVVEKQTRAIRFED